MFQKLTAIEPVSLESWAEKELREYAKEIIIYEDIPSNDEEIIRRIGDSDAVLVSYTSQIRRSVLEHCPSVRYIGMCCSLYSEESANVDIACARDLGITVTGIRDYGDRGVVEYVLSETIRFLHGFDRPALKELPVELTGLPVGIIGMGVSGTMIARAMKFMGAEVSYYSRTRKEELEQEGFTYRELFDLLESSDVVCTCLNKNVLLLGEEEFSHLGEKKLLFNTSIGPSFQEAALKNWLYDPENYFCCDTRGALGEKSEEMIHYPNVFCAEASAGRTKQAFELLSRKVLDNLKNYCTIK